MNEDSWHVKVSMALLYKDAPVTSSLSGLRALYSESISLRASEIAVGKLWLSAFAEFN